MPPEAPYLWTDAVQLVELPRAYPEGRMVGQPSGSPKSRVWRVVGRFLGIVVLPTLLAAAYFGFVAADRYVSEARLLVHSANSMGRLAALDLSMADVPKGSGAEDAYAVREFMLSRDGMRLLLDKADLRQAVARAGRDLVWRFPSVLTGGSDEALYRLYGSLVSVDYQTTTGLIALRVSGTLKLELAQYRSLEAFTPEDARRMAAVLIDGAETLVNRLNERARADAIELAEREVLRSRALAVAAQETLTAFRQRESVVDPTLLSQTAISTIATLSLQAVEVAAELDVTQHTSPNSPRILPLQGRIRAIEGQIDRERGTLAGGQGSFARQIAEYERLLLDRDFAQKGLVSSLNLRETARVDAQRQQSYLDRVAEPRAADEAFYPHRILWVLGVCLAGVAALWAFRPATGVAGKMP